LVTGPGSAGEGLLADVLGEAVGPGLGLREVVGLGEACVEGRGDGLDRLGAEGLTDVLGEAVEAAVEVGPHADSAELRRVSVWASAACSLAAA
jgi:hypothetical protein